MSLWTQSDYVVLGKKETVRKVYDALVEARKDTDLCFSVNPLNAFLVKIGYAGQEDIDKMKSQSEREFPTGHLLNFYGNFENERIRYCNGKESVLEFTTNVKWVFDNCRKAIKEMFPDVQVFGCYFDESCLYDYDSDYRDTTDDTEGVFFRKYSFRVVGKWESVVRRFETNDFKEFADEIERLYGIRPASDKEEDLRPVYEKVEGFRYRVLDILN